MQEILEYYEENGYNRRSRKREVLYPRIYLMAYLRLTQKDTLHSIGELFGYDHATVLHAVNNYKNLVETNDELFNELTTKVQIDYPMGIEIIGRHSSKTDRLLVMFKKLRLQETTIKK